MKVATWNVNGIRAREAQLCDWLERDQPDVVCLQEIKARPDQVPERCKLADYHVLWHGGGGYSGVSLHLRRELLEVPEFSHPEFDIETRIVQVALGNLVLASVYVPNGGKDYPAKLAPRGRNGSTTTGASSSSAATSTSRAPTSTSTRGSASQA